MSFGQIAGTEPRYLVSFTAPPDATARRLPQAITRIEEQDPPGGPALVARGEPAGHAAPRGALAAARAGDVHRGLSRAASCAPRTTPPAHLVWPGHPRHAPERPACGGRWSARVCSTCARAARLGRRRGPTGRQRPGVRAPRPTVRAGERPRPARTGRPGRKHSAHVRTPDAPLTRAVLPREVRGPRGRTDPRWSRRAAHLAGAGARVQGAALPRPRGTNVARLTDEQGWTGSPRLWPRPGRLPGSALGGGACTRCARGGPHRSRIAWDGGSPRAATPPRSNVVAGVADPPGAEEICDVAACLPSPGPSTASSTWPSNGSPLPVRSPWARSTLDAPGLTVDRPVEWIPPAAARTADELTPPRGPGATATSSDRHPDRAPRCLFPAVPSGGRALAGATDRRRSPASEARWCASVGRPPAGAKR
ncbi:hypothetical protein QJS66_09850 [Kocuria rhizophila]|nr:hypothetical protein QJS66_09850 [Kocuria rhizophila]